MSQNTKLVPTHEYSSQSVQVTPTPGAVLPTTDIPVPERREHPDSRHRSAATGEMFPIGFGMREELFCIPAIAAAVDRPNGLECTRERIKSAFYGQWGVESCRFEAQQVAAAQELQHFENERLRITALLKEIPQTRTIDNRVLPGGAARWGWWGLAFALVILNLLAITNAASYFRFQTQGWFVAVLMAAPLLFVSMPVKFVVGKLTETVRKCLGWGLACLGIGAFALFVFTLAARANPPSAADILDGTAQMGTGMIPWQLASQIILEFVIATALWYWLLELMDSNSKLIVNPDAEMLTTRLTALHSAMDSTRGRWAEAQGNLQELQGSLDYWLQLGETIFMAHFERERRLTERVAALNAWPHL